MIAVIVAMESELEAILARCADTDVRKAYGITFYEASLNAKPIVLVLSGIGKVNAAYAATLIMNLYAPSAVLSIGISGGLLKTQKLDLVIADSVVQHDFDLSPVGGDKGLRFAVDQALLARLIQALPQAYVGTVATGDRFVAGNSDAEWISKTFNAVACDMEAAAIAQCASIASVPFACLRSISDNADDNAADDISTFSAPASVRFAEALELLME